MINRMIKIKKMMIYAYTKINLGDDLFIKILCERYPDTKFYIYAPEIYKGIFSELENLTVIPNDTLINRIIDYGFHKLKLNTNVQRIYSKRCDGVIYIGGSIFMQTDNWIRIYNRKSNYQIRNKPFYVIGANFGPHTDEDFLLRYKELFKGYTDICFRDTKSYNLFCNELDNVRLADDVVFHLNPVLEKEKDKNVVISVIKPSYRSELVSYDESYYEKLKAVSIKLLEKGYTITFMAFCEHEGDNEAIASILKRMPQKYTNQKQVNTFIHQGNIEKSLEIFAQSEFVIATRFHAMILGWLYQKKVFPISYSEKMVSVLNDINFLGTYAELKKMDEISVDEIIRGMKKNEVNVTKQIINAEEHFMKLDEYLD